MTSFRILFRGFLFGLLLQVAVGPVCLYVLKSSISEGFIFAETVVMAVTLVDALYIALAILGISAFIGGRRTNLALRICGAIVLILFGTYMIFSQLFKINLIPALSPAAQYSSENPFVSGLILTAANPLTIIFWSGVFASRISEDHYSQRDIIYFSIGCVISTLLFLTAVSFLASLLARVLPEIVIIALNVAVGAALIFYGARMLVCKKGAVCRKQ